MPIYEYLCRDCGKRSTILVRSVSSASDPRCQFCGGANLQKLVSRVAVLRSGGSDDLGDEGSWDGESDGPGGEDMGPMGGGEDEGGEEGGGEDLE